MKDLLTKNDITKILKVSSATLKKFLKKNKFLIENNKINFKKLNKWMDFESNKNYSGGKK
jgi:phage antirepressor YoqD-like protein